MRTNPAFAVFTFLLIAIVFTLTIFNFAPPAVLAQSAAPDGAIQQQATPTPPLNDGSEIGSTDGILIMGIVIVLIVTLPLIFQKKK